MQAVGFGDGAGFGVEPLRAVKSAVKRRAVVHRKTHLHALALKAVAMVVWSDRSPRHTLSNDLKDSHASRCRALCANFLGRCVL